MHNETQCLSPRFVLAANIYKRVKCQLAFELVRKGIAENLIVLERIYSFFFLSILPLFGTRQKILFLKLLKLIWPWISLFITDHLLFSIQILEKHIYCKFIVILVTSMIFLNVIFHQKNKLNVERMKQLLAIMKITVNKWIEACKFQTKAKLWIKGKFKALNDLLLTNFML